MSRRPDRYPLHDTNEVNSSSLPTIYSLNGFPPNSVASAQATNALLGRGGNWDQYNDRTLVRCDNIHSSSTAYRLTSDHLDYELAAGRADMVPTAFTPVYIFRGDIFRFDAAFTTDAGLNTISFEASKTTWIYCDADGGVRIEAVALAAPPSPDADEFVVIGVSTDATDIVDIDTSGAPAYELHFTGPKVLVDVNFDVNGAIVTTGNITCGGNLDMTNGSISNATTIGATDITCTSIVAANAAVTISATSTNVTAAAILGTNNSGGTGVRGTANGVLPAVWGVNGTGPGVKGNGGSAGAGVEGLATATLVPGVLGTGAAAADSHGVVGVAVNTSSHGVAGTTAAAATTSAAGVRADALGDGVALSAVAVNGNAGRFETDTSSPTRAPVVIVAVDADPSTTQPGSLYPNSTRGKWRTHLGIQYESFHSSPKGHLFGVSSVSTSSNTTTSGDIGDITITPEQTGDVIITVTGSWLAPTTDDDTTLTVLLKDITGAVTVATSQAFITIDRDAEAGTTRHMPFMYRFPYTLPSAASRVFRYRLNFAGNGGVAVSWYDVFMTVQGVY